MVTAVFVQYCRSRVPFLSREAYQRQRVLTFTMPPDRVVYEEDPVRAAKLLDLRLDPQTAYVGEPLAVPPFPMEIAAGEYRPCGPGKGWAEYMPRFHQWLFGPAGARGLVFAHERVGPGGHRRMVIVTQMPTYAHHPPHRPDDLNARDGLELSVGASAADRRFNPRRGNNYRHMRIRVGFDQVVRMFAGQVDPNNSGRFTIKYEVDGVPGTIEGRLGADDAVTLRVLDGPAVSSWKAVPRF